MNILAIETSMDETACAVVRDGHEILSSIVSSQVDIHAQYGGVVPEVAARSHIEVIIPVIEQALAEAQLGWEQIDAIATTRGPGLIGSLLIGTLTARTIAMIKHKPLIGVNHIIAHAFASFLVKDELAFPMLAMTVSGGHTALTVYSENLERTLIGETRDDAAGEAFDKVARLLGLSYPGGPEISRVAEHGDENKYKFPIAKMTNPDGSPSYDFSFSGLKTAVLRQVQEITGYNPGNLDLPKTYQLDKQIVADIAASFQKAVVTALVRNTVRAAEELNPASIVVGGGVACNILLRSELHRALPDAMFVPPALCTDNAAMIAALGFRMAQNDMFVAPEALVADSSLEVV